MFYLVLLLLYWTIVFLFQTDLMYVKSDLFPHILKQFKWGFSQFFNYQQKIESNLRSNVQKQRKKDGYSLRVEKLSKTWPPRGSSQKTPLFREASTSDFSFPHALKDQTYGRYGKSLLKKYKISKS